MTSKRISAVLSVALSLMLCMPAEAQSSGGKIVSNGTIVGVIVGAAAGIAVIAVVAIHYSKKRTITGCVHGQGNDLTVTDEKDKQTYMLSGNTSDIKAGDRMTLLGKKVKSTGTKPPLAWQAKKVAKDLGVCQP
jgi:hypothetical protein